MIKLILKLTALSILFGTMVYIFPKESSANSELYLENEDNARAVELYQRIMNHLNKDQEIKYAGAYIDDNNVLNVGLVPENEEKAKEVISDLARNLPIKFYNVKYSYEELENAKEIFKKEVHGKYNIISMDIVEKENKLVIGLHPDTYSTFMSNFNLQKGGKELFERMQLDAEDIVFIEEEPMITQSRTASNQDKKLGGIRITSPNPKGATEESTIGFGVIDKTGKYGFVMSGHPVKGVGTWVSQGGGVGKVITDGLTKRKSDAAYVRTEAGKIVSGTLYGGYKINTHYGWELMPVGAEVIQHGISTNVTTGKITSRNQDLYISSDYKYNSGGMKGLVVATYTSADGDSGGPVTSKTNSSGYVQLFGIHVAAKSGKTYYSPVDSILTDLNLSRPLYYIDGNVKN